MTTWAFDWLLTMGVGSSFIGLMEFVESDTISGKIVSELS